MKRGLSQWGNSPFFHFVKLFGNTAFHPFFIKMGKTPDFLPLEGVCSAALGSFGDLCSLAHFEKIPFERRPYLVYDVRIV